MADSSTIVRPVDPAVGEAAPAATAEIHAARSKVTIRDLDFFYGASQALKHVSLEMKERKVMALIGPSGCGKSTLLRVLNRLYDRYPDQRASGAVLLNGQEILGPDVDVRRLRRRVGMVFQESTVFQMSVYENIAFGIRIQERASRADIEARVEASLTRADLWHDVKDRLSSPAAALSGGQQQRLCIARALATRPEVLLLDEPTSALDPASTSKIEELIGELKKELVIAFVTHNMSQAARCADHVAFLYLGELVETGTANHMFDSPKERRTQEYISGHFG